MDEVTTLSPNNGNTNVIGSQCSPTGKKVIVDVTESRVWVQIGNVGVGFEKQNFVNLIEQSESYINALSLLE